MKRLIIPGLCLMLLIGCNNQSTIDRLDRLGTRIIALERDNARMADSITVLNGGSMGLRIMSAKKDISP